MTMPQEPVHRDEAVSEPFGLAAQLGPPSARRYVSKPAAVQWGLGILWVGVVLTVVLAFLAMLLLAGASAGAGAAGDGAVMGIAVTFLVVGLAIVVVQAVLLVFAGKGRGWARMALAVVCVASLVVGLVSNGSINVGAVLTIVAIVLLFLPASNEWYDAQGRA
ncbi:hypothetical protein [Agrococcus jejuensis]|uniref:hypothetical protein n=1 Tax=Agrococcus jejuensis TaxID=399736 RepID=UPI0011A37468|nr:hypothetical protein [Agrococcus jejuensis]